MIALANSILSAHIGLADALAFHTGTSAVSTRQHGQTAFSSDCKKCGGRTERLVTLPNSVGRDTAYEVYQCLDCKFIEWLPTEIFFPSVIVNNSVSADLFIGAPMTGWPLLIDIDALDPNNSVDRCCWPSLDSLKALIGAEK